MGTLFSRAEDPVNPLSIYCNIKSQRDLILQYIDNGFTGSSALENKVPIT